MIDEKTMVADTLAGINGELTRFGEMIPQTENKQLKQTLKQLRNACESSQEEIYPLKQNTADPVHHRLRCFSLLFISYCCFKVYHLSAIFN